VLFAQLPPNQPEQDCPNALPVCQNIFVQPNSYQGEGQNPNEIGGTSCLGGGEVNDVWYIFTVQSPGNLCFSITPANNDDYDWAVYNLTNATCADIATNGALEVSCNFAPNLGCGGVTGPNGQTAGPCGGQNEPCIPVVAGETFVINVSNWSGTGSGYTLDFSTSTAVIFDTISPVIDSVSVPCGASTITTYFSENIVCSTVDPTDFTLTGPGGPYTVTAVNGANCLAGFNFERVFEVVTAPPITTSGVFTVSLVDTVEDNCGNVGIFTSINVNIATAGVGAFAAPSSICSGDSSILSTNFSGTPGYNFVWNPGNISSPTVTVFPNTTTTYTVTATDPAGCVSNSTVTVNVTPTPSSSFSSSNSQTCTGDVVSIIYTGGASPGATYIWDFDGGNATPGTGQGPHGVSWTTPGTKTITLTVSENNCTSVQTAITVDVGLTPTSTFSSSAIQVCGNQPVTVTHTGVASPTALFTWDFAGGTAVPGVGPGPHTVTFGTSGPKVITLSVADGNCTSSVSSATIDAFDVPTTTFTAVPSVICDNQAATVTYTGNATTNANYIWDFDGGVAIPGTGPGPHTITWPSSGTKNITLNVEENGCLGTTSSATVTVGITPTADFTVPSPICQGDSGLITYTGNGPASANYTWDFDGAVVQSGGGQGPYQVTWLSPGTKSVCLQVENNGCPSPQVCIPVDVRPTPIANIAPITNQCFDGNSFSFSPTGTTANVDAYFWSFGPDASPPFSTLPTPTGISFTTPGVKTASLVVVLDGCVSDTATITFNVIQEPSADFSVNAGNLCLGDCFEFTYEGSPIPNQTYNWDFGASAIPNSSTLQNPSCVAFTSPGTYQVTLTVNNQGCTTTFTDQIIYNGGPVINGGPDNEFCDGSGGAQMTSTVTGGTPPYTYQWTCDAPNGNCGLSSPYVSNPVANPDSTTTYYVQATDFNGCQSNVDTVIITVKALPIANAGPDTTICEAGPGMFLQGSVEGEAPGPFTYSWTPTSGMAPGNDSLASPYIRPDTTTIYTLIVESINGCSSLSNTLDTLSTVIINVNPLPIANAGADTALCLGETIMLQGFGTGAGPQYDYIWTPNDALTGISDSTAATPTVSPQFTTTFSLVVNSNGCPSEADQVTVVVNTIPTTSAGPPKDVCLGDSVLLDGTAAGDPDGVIYTYTWTPTAGLADPNNPKTLASPDTTTTYYLDAGVGTCSGLVDSIRVEVRPTPIASVITNDTSICAGDALMLEGTHSFTTTPNAAPVIYQWSPNENIDDMFSTTPTVTPSQTVIYTLTTSVAGDCPTTDQVYIEVFPEINPQITADTTSICLGQSTTLHATGGVGSAQFTWQPSSGINDTTTADPVVSPDTTTTYYVTVQEAICSERDSITILVHPTPQADYFASQSSGCAGIAVSFIDNSEGSTALVWDFGDGSPVSNEDNPVHVFGTPGSYDVTLTAYGAGGCNTSTTLTTVTVSDTSFADFTSDPTDTESLVLPDGSINFTDLSANAVGWLWDFGDGKTSSEQSPAHNYQAAGEYTVSLSVINQDGCISTVSHGPYLVVNPTLFIPNVFSPNGDGLYDQFDIIYNGVETYNLNVYDRWGKKMFSADAPTERWDGTNNGGATAPEGVYYYQITVGTKSYQGDVTLIR